MAGRKNMTLHDKEISIKLNFEKIERYAMSGGSLSPQHGGSSGCGWRNGL
jgi:hypothetical protein